MKKRGMAVIGMAVVCFVMMGSAAYGYNEAHRYQLENTGNCPNCDLKDINLAGKYLKDANLSNANLSGAHMVATNLIGANLSSANLSNANLMGANLSGANLSGANLSSAYLQNAYLQNANLQNANLTGAILTGSMFEYRLADADLSGATWMDGSKCKSGSIGKCIK